MTTLLQAMLQDGDIPNEVLIDAIRDTFPEWPGGDAMATVYVVRGNTGEHSDSREWDVEAFLDKNAADIRCKELVLWCERNGVRQQKWEMIAGRMTAVGPAPTRYPQECPLDPDFNCGDGGVDYGVFPVPLRG